MEEWGVLLMGHMDLLLLTYLINQILIIPLLIMERIMLAFQLKEMLV